MGCFFNKPLRCDIFPTYIHLNLRLIMILNHFLHQFNHCIFLAKWKVSWQSGKRNFGPFFSVILSHLIDLIALLLLFSGYYETRIFFRRETERFESEYGLARKHEFLPMSYKYLLIPEKINVPARKKFRIQQLRLNESIPFKF